VTLALGKINLSPRATLGAAIGLVVLLAVAGFMLVIAPKRSQISSLDSQITDVQGQLLAKTREQQKATTPKGLTRAELTSILRALPDTPEMPGLVLQLSSLATQAGVTLDTITPAPPTSATGYQAIPLTVVVDGRFFAVREFLRSLRTQVKVKGTSVEATGRLFDVQGIDLEQTEPAPQVRASLTLQAFVYGTSPAQAAPVTPAGGQAVGVAR
jgi:Tfp pilus assembly protein PilO